MSATGGHRAGDLHTGGVSPRCTRRRNGLLRPDTGGTDLAACSTMLACPPNPQTRGAPTLVVFADDARATERLVNAFEQRGLDVRTASDREDLVPRASRASLLVMRLSSSVALEELAVIGRLRERGWPGHVLLLAASGPADLRARVGTISRVDVVEEPFALDGLVAFALGMLFPPTRRTAPIAWEAGSQ